MSLPDLVIRGKRVVLPGSASLEASDSEKSEGRARLRIVPASIHINDGVIAQIGSYAQVPAGCEIVEADEESVVMPGLVDTHVHVNEPGRTNWEGFRTATRAAAAGGVTTLVDMPLNSTPATTTVAALESKRAAARGQCLVDVGFWGGVVPGDHEHPWPLARAR